MVEASHLRDLHYLAGGGRLGRPGLGRVLAKAEVGSGSVIVGEVLGEDAAEVPGVQDNNVVEALAPNGTDQALSVRILPGCPRSGEHLGDAVPEHAVAKRGTIDCIAIPKQVAGCRFPRERLHNLASRPLCCGMVCDVEVEHSPWIRGAPQSEFVVAIRRMSLKSSGSTRGLPGRR